MLVDCALKIVSRAFQKNLSITRLEVRISKTFASILFYLLLRFGFVLASFNSLGPLSEGHSEGHSVPNAVRPFTGDLLLEFFSDFVPRLDKVFSQENVDLNKA